MISFCFDKCSLVVVLWVCLTLLWVLSFLLLGGLFGVLLVWFGCFIYFKMSLCLVFMFSFCFYFFFSFVLWVCLVLLWVYIYIFLFFGGGGWFCLVCFWSGFVFYIYLYLHVLKKKIVWFCFGFCLVCLSFFVVSLSLYVHLLFHRRGQALLRIVQRMMKAWTCAQFRTPPLNSSRWTRQLKTSTLLCCAL